MELISGKDAAIRYLNGENVLHLNRGLVGVNNQWADCKGMDIDDFKNDRWAFKLKPKTIMLNGIEVPAPFEPKDGDTVFVLANFIQQGYLECKYPTFEGHVFQFGAWHNEEEIKQVVASLRSIFNAK